MARQYIVEPQIPGDVVIGTEGDDTRVYLGQLAETGPSRKLYFGVAGIRYVHHRQAWQR